MVHFVLSVKNFFRERRGRGTSATTVSVLLVRQSVAPEKVLLLPVGRIGVMRVDGCFFRLGVYKITPFAVCRVCIPRPLYGKPLLHVPLAISI